MLHSVAIAGAQAIVNANETSVATETAFNVANPGGQGVVISGVVNILAGTGTTAVVVRVRQGVGTAGTVVGSAKTHTLAAGASASIPFSELDVNLAATGQQYSVTVQQTGGSANGTVNGGTINADTATSAN